MSEFTFTVRKADWHNKIDNEKLLRLRFSVFVDEQGVPQDLEVDETDESAFHFIAEKTDTNSVHSEIGCMRLCQSGRVSRLCVLKDFRSEGVGNKLLQLAIVEARRQNFREVHLHAQTHATSFYENVGFITNGGIFMEAGIPHRMMILSL